MYILLEKFVFPDPLPNPFPHPLVIAAMADEDLRVTESVVVGVHRGALESGGSGPRLGIASHI